jgi:regulator of protease activity HflC (stomatin/prohibitin superfamily)
MQKVAAQQSQRHRLVKRLPNHHQSHQAKNNNDKFNIIWNNSIMSITQFVVLFLFLFGLVTLFSSIKIVKQQSAYTIETLGKFTRVILPGITLVIPFLQLVSRRVNLATIGLDIKIQAITSDKVTVTIDTVLIYKVNPTRIYEAAYTLDNAVSTLKALVENNIRAYVATITHEDAIRSRDEMTNYLVHHITDKLFQYGYDLESIQFRDIILPSEITEAMSRVVASKRLQEAATNEAGAEYIKQVRLAEAQRETRRLQGEGMALERSAITEGLSSSIKDLQAATGVSAQSVMTLVMMNQYIDMMRNNINDKNGNTKTIILNGSPNGANETMAQFAELIR